MQFFYHKNAKQDSITLEAKDFHYLFHVRRFKNGEILKVRNLIDDKLYFYKHRKKEVFDLDMIIEDKRLDTSKLNLIVAIIDPKDIYDILPSLNALNVRSLNLFYADFSQKNRKLDETKMQKIVQYSCMQCGRTAPIQISIFANLNEILQTFQHACYIDFANTHHYPVLKQSDITPQYQDDTQITLIDKTLETLEHLHRPNLAIHAEQGIIIGAEGGFSRNERHNVLQNQTCYALATPYILTTHLASLYIASLCCSC